MDMKDLRVRIWPSFKHYFHIDFPFISFTAELSIFSRLIFVVDDLSVHS